MTERWKMNRIGFVNFWLYDEEDFEFADGKLLLRGQNGSGKSITTQSFIPFVLDGDRTPSRLDPFGSSDRRMEYYFLGEEGKDESTGYLFLEFSKDHGETKEYRTIGIGQRAKRGKPMDFWGFVILDGRRIGTDLWLYKEVGTSRIPIDKREMRAALGEENFITDSQSEYKKHVNQYIFGFRKEEQYEQFIKLLVKVRAPKLSKEFKPTKVYEILNDSLQTLTDEDLRAMVDAMEKMDEIQDSLEMLNRAFSDIRAIRTEYTRYNQYMLAKKAQAYLKKKQEVLDAKQKLDAMDSQIRQMTDSCEEKRVLFRQLKERKILAETERNGLMDMNLEEIDHKLEMAREQRAVAAKDMQHWVDKIDHYKEKIRIGYEQLKELQECLQQKQQDLQEQTEELEEQQEILQWDQFESAIRMVRNEETGASEEVAKSLNVLKKLLEECKKAIAEYEELGRRYDSISQKLEQEKSQKLQKEQALEEAKEQVVRSIDKWIVDLYELGKASAIWQPDPAVLQEAEQKVREYQSVKDAGTLQELLRSDYEKQRQKFLDIRYGRENERRQKQESLEQTLQDLDMVRNQEELEPERDECTKESRAALQQLGIPAVPFYKTVEFSEELDPAASARLEAQLQKAGILDALVVSQEDLDRIKEQYPEFLDSIISIEQPGNSDFAGLVAGDELASDLRDSVQQILSNIYESDEKQAGICLKQDGWYRQGILLGRADKAGDAEYIGVLARKRRKEQRISELTNRLEEQTKAIKELDTLIAQLNENLTALKNEYGKLPGFAQINASLDQEKESSFALQQIQKQYQETLQQENRLVKEKNNQYQIVLQQCRPFPYGRTERAYDDAIDAAEEFGCVWQEIRQNLLSLENTRSSIISRKDMVEQDENSMDDAFAQRDKCSTEVKKRDVEIQQCEEYLNRPDIVEKANRLKTLREELRNMETKMTSIDKEMAVLNDRLEHLTNEEPEQKSLLQQKIAHETLLRSYFEEELSLKLVIEQENKALSDCAGEAVGLLREGDKDKSPSEMFQSLYLAYQRHNGSLTSYGTAIENCFAADISQQGGETDALRSRARIVSTWNGKKVYLEEFYHILKAAIDETELLIQKKDRELFEDILSQTISQQLTDRIAESRKWVWDMSKLMREMDTSMGLSFSLDWKPRKAENDVELDTAELEEILLRDRALLTMDDIERVAAHFRSKIRMEKQKLEEDNGVINYMDLVRDALDYRKWFEFHMFFRKGEEPKKLLTNAAFNRFSGGEKAMAMYVPLFAAVNAQYQKAEKKDHPRMVALDEAFAGVDDKNISSMFELVQKLDFDYIMNSQALWGCFKTVKRLRIAELLRPQNSKTVSVIRYTWNGRERVLDEQ